MVTINRGLRFRKLDLHVHTPASKCYTGNGRHPSDIVDAAINAGLDAIAITDHNTGEWIDLVKKEADKVGLTIFPGIEITSSEGIHVVALFDIDKDTAYIANLLGELRIDTKLQGKPEAISEKGVREITEIIVQRGGLAILAHIDGPKGAYTALGGQPLIKLFNESPFIAVETKSGKLPKDFNAGGAIKRKVICYQASDNPNPEDEKKHSSEGIGRPFTYFKLGDKINLEGLRQCFTDSDVRICLADKYEEMDYPQIISLKASDGFLKDQTIAFHPGLNSIIGGKGVGKSLIVEFLRFGLFQASNSSDIEKDHTGKLDNRLGQNNNVEVEFQLKDGIRYKVVRTHCGQHKCTNVINNEEFRGNIASLFPILAYSQTEVISISQNSQAQLDLIDGFINKDQYVNRIDEINEKLAKNDVHYSACIEATYQLQEVQKDIATLNEMIKAIDLAFSDDEANKKIINEYNLLEKKSKAFDSIILSSNKLMGIIKTAKTDASKINIQSVDSSESDEALIASLTIFEAGKKETEQQLTILEESLVKYIKKITEQKEEFLPELREKKAQYVEISEKEENKNAQGNNRDQHAARLSKLQLKEMELLDTCTNFDEVKKKRIEYIQELHKIRDEFYNDRVNIFDSLSRKSMDELKLEISHGTDRSAFKEGLSKLVKGSGIQGITANIDRICENLTPSEFVIIALSRDLDGLTQKSQITKGTAQRLLDKIWSCESLDNLLKIEYECYPEDTPSIKYQRAKGEYAPLDQLSIGQKCTALLIIALIEGDRPVIIDQPEDALDITTVWNNISKRLRECKNLRQFILTTHNPTVSVSSDSDLFIEVRSNSNRANVKVLGGIEEQRVKDAVIDHLEGGDEAYHLRMRKYNIHKE